MARLKAAERREQLMDVATKLFAQHGYDATTTAAIAHAAGVTEPILYRHFRGKQEMFVAIVECVSQKTVQHWKAIIEDVADPVEQLRRIAQEFHAHVTASADAYHVIHGALANSQDKKVLQVVRDHYAAMAEFFATILTAGQQAGFIRQDLDPHVPAWQLISAGIGHAMIALNLPTLYEDINPTEMIELSLRSLRNEQHV
ncbi:MAG TPA: TetR/AcrR family transcriptional regulator [Tepidisphaeraceae bacterium]|nr:TetR/AcrR family transcriptional regulator [Tepidisphaeraceae bacterium]